MVVVGVLFVVLVTDRCDLMSSQFGGEGNVVTYLSDQVVNENVYVSNDSMSQM